MAERFVVTAVAFRESCASCNAFRREAMIEKWFRNDKENVVVDV